MYGSVAEGLDRRPLSVRRGCRKERDHRRLDQVLHVVNAFRSTRPQIRLRLPGHAPGTKDEVRNGSPREVRRQPLVPSVWRGVSCSDVTEGNPAAWAGKPTLPPDVPPVFSGCDHRLRIQIMRLIVARVPVVMLQPAAHEFRKGVIRIGIRILGHDLDPDMKNDHPGHCS